MPKTHNTYNKLYAYLNTKGYGYAVGDDNDNVNDIRGLGTLIKDSSFENDVAVYLNQSIVTMVGDANGPWAIDIE